MFRAVEKKAVMADKSTLPKSGYGADIVKPIGRQAMLGELNQAQQRDLEVAAFRRLLAHLQSRTDVQNIDMMNLAGFCRNCLSNWLKDAADEQGIALSKEQARGYVYGMPYEEWKARHQSEATPAQQDAFNEALKNHG